MNQAFQQRAEILKTALHKKRYQKRDALSTSERQGLSKEEYWQQKVKTSEDAFKYYQLYYPEYPDILIRVLVNRIDTVMEKYNQGEELTENEKKLLEDSKSATINWDYKQEIEEQKKIGKISQELLDLDVPDRSDLPKDTDSVNQIK